MAVVAAWRTGPTTLLATGAWWLGRRANGSLVWRVGGGRFCLAAKELAFAQAELGTQLLQFGLEFGEAGASALMHALPVTGLLAKFEVFGEQRAAVTAWGRSGRRRALDRWGSGKMRNRVRRKIHTTSMNCTQLRREVSRGLRTCLPKSYPSQAGPGAVAAPRWPGR